MLFFSLALTWKDDRVVWKEQSGTSWASDALATELAVDEALPDPCMIVSQRTGSDEAVWAAVTAL